MSFPDLDSWVAMLLHWLAVPEQGLLALALVAFLAASVVPLSSEALLLAVAAAQPQQFWVAWAVATTANTLGSMTTYWLGRCGQRVVPPTQLARPVAWFERHGTATLVLAWVPLLGDALVIVAGWLRLHAWACLAWITLGKAVRYGLLLAALPVT